MLAATAVALAPVAANGAPAAETGVTHGAGLSVPGQLGGTLWLGQYKVNIDHQAQNVFCVDYALKAPDGRPYVKGDVLKTKWGDPLPVSEASDISYLLLKYGNTTDDNMAAAIAHLLHTWTAPPTKGHTYQSGPKNRAYNSKHYFSVLPSAAKNDVTTLKAQAAKFRAPWKATLAAPSSPQLIGKPGTWTISVATAGGTPVPDVPVTLAAKNAKLDHSTLTTDAKGTASVTVTPSAAQPSVSASLITPNTVPHVLQPTGPDGDKFQKVVIGGGEQNLSATVTIKPGVLHVAKLDAATGKGIGGVALRITGADKTSPALKADSSKLVGADGKAAVVQTAADGTVSVPDLLAPQRICVIEAAAKAGYDQHYDAAHPPTVCGTLKQGETLSLTLKNIKNKVIVPIKINAGGSVADASASAATSGAPAPGALFGFGAGLVVLAGAGSVLIGRRRAAAKRR
ncbi:MAG: Ig-like domain-containing protein [Sciscionella sp.]